MTMPDTNRLAVAGADEKGGDTPGGGSFVPPAEAAWHRKIAEAAYYIAEKRGFGPGDPTHDWLQAERTVRGRM
jgi:hypothetical protein